MIVDARKFAGSALDADIVIVGTGPAGMSVAFPLLESRKRIVFLEAGQWKPNLKGQLSFWSAGQPISNNHPPLHLYRRRVFGGTSTVWGGRCIPLDPSDFEAIPGVRPDQWPIGYEDVANYYAAALSLLDAGANEFHAAAAFHDEQDSPLNDAMPRIERFSLPTDVGQKFRRALATHKRALVLINAPCVEILTEASGNKVRGARCRVNGADLIVRSRIVVLANGGLESARLLLSSNSLRPCGLGNSRDLVGRFYMSQLSVTCGWLHFLDPSAEKSLGLRRTRDGVYGQRIIHIKDSVRRDFGLMNFAFRPSVADASDPSHRDPVLSGFYLLRRFRGIPENKLRYKVVEDRSLRMNARHVLNIARGFPRAATFAVGWAIRKRFVRRRLPILSLQRGSSRYPLEINSEQQPQRDSRVFLSQLRDPLGMPMLNVDWRVSSLDRETIFKAYKLASRLITIPGKMSLSYSARELEEALEKVVPCGGHHLGTTRMGASSVVGVIGPDCQVWDTEGLYVAGSGIFTTGGFANPTLTIVALGLRLGDYLKTRAC